MATERHPSMAGFRARIAWALGWPGAQLRRIADEVAERVDASRQATRAKLAKARAENAGKVIEVSPPSSKTPPSPTGRPPRA
jgi:hypothetical protein